ncbi:hypothetical protein PFICI_07172 [Pestalotiopsis fici W106-1]|uniref:Uncharacterized protein n=1 Tax=Pestalotiopsis fici (strain W106-1 / CGMCC3.15140) TaxID=1229662 RepID=W3X7Y8_PESFW|nr:uncharacterized protein PFICI_07172 [Pestalotiopsis fici W106-1]ETS82170.1 hypothetical protein PFICI_07172 [Pestalotiopsis fici W106-1]
MASTINSQAVFQEPVVSQVSLAVCSWYTRDLANPVQSEIEAFHSQHFSNAAVELFASDFLQPQPSQDDQYYEEYYEDYYDEEDDGLGYYPDGVKRTLTDEQIAIFRHSEVEALRRAEEKKSAHGTRKPIEVGGDGHGESEVVRGTSLPEADTLEDGEEGEIESDTPKPSTTTTSKKKKKKNKSKKNRQSTASNSADPQRGDPGWFKRTVKPDLRKRTWDVVETGMDSLDYDELEGNAGTNAGQTAQRRRISYDD